MHPSSAVDQPACTPVVGGRYPAGRRARTPAGGGGGQRSSHERVEEAPWGARPCGCGLALENLPPNGAAKGASESGVARPFNVETNHSREAKDTQEAQPWPLCASALARPLLRGAATAQLAPLASRSAGQQKGADTGRRASFPGQASMALAGQPPLRRAPPASRSARAGGGGALQGRRPAARSPPYPRPLPARCLVL